MAITLASPKAGTRPGDHLTPIRLGAPVALFDGLLATQSQVQDVGPLRRQYDRTDSRLLLDVTASGRVRQITIGRERNAPETWVPDPGDWTVTQAERLARTWLPPDASFQRSEPFSFRDRIAGRVEIYACPSLRTVFTPDEAASLGARSPGDTCAVTYYQTETGGVASALIGRY
ncbi:MAG TPA: hypothetical protein VGW38_07490 [Chloroflexota bacterium]|nr:hypothetical protein [Chloroflexota bacterium]